LRLNINEIHACKALFFSISFFVGLWTVRIPDIKDQIGTDYQGMSFLFVIFSLGSISTMVIAPKVIQNFSSKSIGLLTGSVISFLWLLIPFVSSFYQMAILSFIFGSSYGVIEIVLNLQATSLEKKYQKPIMSGIHAFWSIGLLVGSFGTSLFLEFQISFFINSLVFIGLIFPLIFFGSLTLKNTNSAQQSFSAIFFRWPKIVLILVIFSTTSVFLEGGTDSWGALYMRDYLLAEGFNIGIAAIAFNGAMVFGRLTGDKLKSIFGIYNFLFISIVLSLLGSMIILISSSIFISILGFIVAGFGVSSVVPICYTLVSRIENLDQTVGVTIITIAVYGNFTIAPPLLGYTANLLGVHYVYLPISILFFVCTAIIFFNKKILKFSSF
jgi:MFS family permease